MSENAEIRISNRQKNYSGDDGKPVEDKFQSVVTGQYNRKDNKIYLRYEEKVEESAPAVKSCLKLFDGCMQLTRSGDVKVTMLFEEGKEHKTGYITPYGTLALTVRTKHLHYTDSEEKLQAAVKYELDLEDSLFAVCDMEIHVQKGKGE